ncbi:MAG: hypothetical protein MZV49_24780 [Rhodopseudomonas palustris]|nr:hypothetical protein [Rhodopseudomonas palustris]
MRIILVHPNYHSGGAEIAGNWPPAWAAYIAGALKSAGFTDVQFIDAMTDDISDETSRGVSGCAEARHGRRRPSITPSIYKAERTLQIAQAGQPELRCACSAACTPPSCISRCSTEAPWVDAIVRGEGEEIVVTLARTIDEGRWPRDRAEIQGIAYIEQTAEGDEDHRHAGRADRQGSRCDQPGLGHARLEQVSSTSR